MKRVAILISGGGSNMVALVKSMTGDHPARPCVVMSNDPDAGGLKRAEAMGVPTGHLSHKGFESREAFDAALRDQLDQYQPDILCLAGFMRIFTPVFTDHWAGRALNIHPSLLPKHKGLHTHARALEAGDRLHGCSVHEVTAELDGGPVLGQASLRIRADDTPETLAARVLPLEHKLYPAVLRRYVAGERTPVLIDETGA